MKYELDIARGLIPGVQLVSVIGRNGDIDTSAEDIINIGGSFPYLSAAETIDVVSSSANDSSGGTGAQKVLIQGLSSAWSMIEEKVTLNGTTPVTTTKSFLRTFSPRVLDAGSGGVNAGTIDFDPTTTGSGSRQAQIAIGEGTAHNGIYSIPAGHTGFLINPRFSIYPTSGVTELVGNTKLWIRTNGHSWLDISESQGYSQGMAVDQFVDLPYVLDQKTDFRASGTGGTTDIVYSFWCSILLVKDNTVDTHVVNSYGYDLEHQMYEPDGTTVKDLTSNTALEIMISNQDTNDDPQVFTASLVGAATDGLIKYTLAAGDLNTPGRYLMTGHATFASEEYWSPPETILVVDPR